VRTVRRLRRLLRRWLLRGWLLLPMHHHLHLLYQDLLISMPRDMGFGFTIYRPENHINYIDIYDKPFTHKLWHCLYGMVFFCSILFYIFKRWEIRLVTVNDKDSDVNADMILDSDLDCIAASQNGNNMSETYKKVIVMKPVTIVDDSGKFRVNWKIHGKDFIHEKYTPRLNPDFLKKSHYAIL
ncbi:Uncharacterized protein OBRU01_14993, partial [Operophtera brumata]